MGLAPSILSENCGSQGSPGSISEEEPFLTAGRRGSEGHRSYASGMDGRLQFLGTGLSACARGSDPSRRWPFHVRRMVRRARYE